MLKRTAVAAALVTLSLAAGACSSDGSVSSDEVEEKLEEANEGADFSCDDDLKGEEGEEIICTVTDDSGEEQDVRVFVTDVDGNTVNFDAEPVTEE